MTVAVVPTGGNGADNEPAQSKLVVNLMHFARALRVAGLPIGPGKVLDGVNAIRAVGVGNRTDFYWALHAVFVNRHDQHEVFDQAFHIFWRDPKILERLMGMSMPDLEPGMAPPEEPPMRRVQDAFRPEAEEADQAREGEGGDKEEEEEEEFDAVMTASSRELLHTMDFDEMTAEEVARAKAAIARMRLPIPEVKQRRYRPHLRRARIDMRATLRSALRSGAATIPLKWRKPSHRPPPLVILCDISGSMSRYSRMLLHFLHAISNDRTRVHVFLFGTRLTNITRHLREKDIDLALAKCAEAAEDWSGGTRIGATLHEFNTQWGRRVLGQGAVVLLISDGLDRDAGRGLQIEMERLHKSCRRLIWLNPLLRFEGFQPKSQGIQAILPHVDEFRPVHNLESLEQLIAALMQPAGRRLEGASEWLKQM
jgi:hypothetical protein